MRWTTSAEKDLESVGKPETVMNILDAVEELAVSPSAGKAGMIPGTRELVPTGLPLVVVYKVEGETLLILRVLPRGDA